MGLVRSLFRVGVYGTLGTTAALFYMTRDSTFVPVSPQDPIFSSPAYRRNNPNCNPDMRDMCVRTVPLGKIKPQLLEKEGKLVEAFCAGVWGGLGL
jgi:hypothetical protein